jgi:hypothetical protein
MPPTQQRLDPSDPAAMEDDDWLIFDIECVRVDGRAQLGLELDAVDQRCPDTVGEYLARPASAALRGRQGGVDVLHQRVGVVIRCRPGDPGASADRNLAPIDRDRSRDGLANTLADLHEVALLRHVLEQQAKLVGAKPRRGVAPTECGVQPRGDCRQHAIASAEAERVVDRSEPIDVEQHHRDRPLVTMCPRERVRQPVSKENVRG